MTVRKLTPGNGPRTNPLTQCDVDNNVCWPKMRANVAVRIWEVGSRHSLILRNRYWNPFKRKRNSGRTQVSVLIVLEPFAASSGMDGLCRFQNHTAIYSSVRSIAYLRVAHINFRGRQRSLRGAAPSSAVRIEWGPIAR
jgi:hypothetical protein